MSGCLMLIRGSVPSTCTMGAHGVKESPICSTACFFSGFQIRADPGKYALMGAAAQLGEYPSGGPLSKASTGEGGGGWLCLRRAQF